MRYITQGVMDRVFGIAEYDGSEPSYELALNHRRTLERRWNASCRQRSAPLRRLRRRLSPQAGRVIFRCVVAVAVARGL